MPNPRFRAMLAGGVATIAMLVAVPGAAAAFTPIAAGHGGFSVTTTADTVDANIGDNRCADASGRCSLRAAIQEANADPERTSVDVPGGTYTLTIANGDGDEEAAATGDLDVTSEINLDAEDATVDADGIDRAFEVMADASLEVEELAVTNGLVNGGDDPVVGSGGAFANAGTLSLDRVRLSQNEADGPAASGGAILNSGALEVSRSTLSDNSATRAGGAIEANGGRTTIERSNLSANSTGPMPGNGGALHLTGDGEVLVERSVVADNAASAEGGGLWNSAVGTMTVDRTELTGNVASGNDATQGGGALYNDGGVLTVDRGEIIDNRADGDAGSGGGILNNGGQLNVERTRIVHNTSMRAGGGIEANVGTTRLERAVLAGNATGPNPGNGGGLHITGAGDATITRTEVTDNRAAREGGGLWNGSGSMVVERSEISGNVASGDAADDGGGGLFNNGGELTVTDSEVEANSADGASGSGGGLFNNQGELSVTDSEVAENTSVRAGGGIEARATEQAGARTQLDDVELSDNRTGANPGNGGGLHLTGPGQVDIDDSSVTDNVAAAEGGGLWNSSTGTTIVTDTSVEDNEAPVGPEVFNDGGTFVLNGAPVPTTNP